MPCLIAKNVCILADILMCIRRCPASWMSAVFKYSLLAYTQVMPGNATLLLLVLWCRFAVSCPLEASLTTEMGISNQSNSAAGFVQIRRQLSFGRVLFREELFFMSMRKRSDHRPVLLRSEGYPALFGLNPVFFLPGQVTMVSYAKWITCSEACSVHMIELSFLEYRILS